MHVLLEIRGGARAADGASPQQPGMLPGGQRPPPPPTTTSLPMPHVHKRADPFAATPDFSPNAMSPIVQRLQSAAPEARAQRPPLVQHPIAFAHPALSTGTVPAASQRALAAAVAGGHGGYGREPAAPFAPRAAAGPRPGTAVAEAREPVDDAQLQVRLPAVEWCVGMYLSWFL